MKSSDTYDFDKNVNILGSRFEVHSSRNKFSKKSSQNQRQPDLGKIIVQKAKIEKRAESGRQIKVYQSVPNIKLNLKLNNNNKQ